MKNNYLLLLACCFSFFSQAQSWIFYPSQTTTKYLSSNSTTNWVNNTDVSIRTDYVYTDGKLMSLTTKRWNGAAFVTDDNSIKIEYTYNGNNIANTVIKYWNGSTYALTTSSIKTEYTYNSDNQISYTITKYYNGNSWTIEYLYIYAQSIKTEYVYSGGVLSYTVTKYFDGASWNIEYENLYIQSIKTEYTYANNQLQFTVSKYYDGSSWNLEYEYLPAQSVKHDYTYVNDHLSYTVKKYYNGSAWYLDDMDSQQASVKTEYAGASTAGLDAVAESELISVYPNPSNGKFYLSGNGFQAAKVEVYSLTGVKVYESESTEAVDLSGFDKGIYFINLTDGTAGYSKKVVLD